MAKRKPVISRNSRGRRKPRRRPGERMRFFSIFINGKKAGSFQSGVRGEKGRHRKSDNSFVGYSDGEITSELSTDTITPVAGQAVRLLDAFERKATCDIGTGIIDGQILTTKMRLLVANCRLDKKTGNLVGEFRFGGGPPIAEKRDMAQAFDEWMRRFVKDPSGFEAEFQSVAKFKQGRGKKKATSYGLECAAYLQSLMG